jgi:hypothetical protein
MATLRSKCVSTKVTHDQYAAFVHAAQGRRIGAWAQDVLVAAADSTRPSLEHILLAELLALRTIVLNLHFALASGEALTPDTMQRLIERADHDKVGKAQERLASVSQRRRV